MKNRNRIKTLFAIAFIATVVATFYLVPAIAQPGDASDPLVTRNFVESRIAQVMEEINGLRAAINNISPGAVHTPSGTGGTLSEADRNALFQEFLLYFDVIYGEMLRAAAGYGQPMPPGGSNITVPDIGTRSLVPLEPIFIPAGSTLVGHEGTEFLLRTGQATAITGENGIINVTAGRDVMNGEQIPANHLLIVPRSDGRGFLATTDLHVMIRGGFDIVS